MGLTALQEEAVERVAKAPDLSPLETNDREDDLADWLDDHSVSGGFDIAPVLVAAGLDRDFLEHVAASVLESVPAPPPGSVALPPLDGAIRWITYTVETELLMNEIADAVTRVSKLVNAAKQYSQLDRADHQDTDVHEGIKSTMVILGSKVGPNIRVVKDFDRTPADGAGLPRRAQPGMDEPHRQRAGRDGRIGRRGHAHPAHDPRGRLPADRGRRHRPRCAGGAAGPDLRALLHHQAGRRGHRAGTRHLVPDRRPAPRRRPPGRVRPGRHPLPGAAADGDIRPTRPTETPAQLEPERGHRWTTYGSATPAPRSRGSAWA